MNTNYKFIIIKTYMIISLIIIAVNSAIRNLFFSVVFKVFKDNYISTIKDSTNKTAVKTALISYIEVILI